MALGRGLYTDEEQTKLVDADVLIRLASIALQDVLSNKDIDLSWTFALALREGGNGTVGWTVPWKMASQATGSSVEDRPVLPAKEEAQWARLLDLATRKNPELLAFVAVINAEMFEKSFSKLWE